MAHRRLQVISGHLAPSPTRGRAKGPAGWQPEVDDLEHRKQIIRTADVKDPGYVRQKLQGKLWVRDRIDAFVDAGSFREFGAIAGKPEYGDPKESNNITKITPGNYVGGRATVDNRPIVVGADDFSVRGGHADGAIGLKSIYGERMAVNLRLPMIRLLDGSSGGRTYPPPLTGIEVMVKALTDIPVACAILGPAVGLGAAKATISHFSVVAGDIGQLFAAGPPVVEYSTFEKLTKDELGGALSHTSNGSIDNWAANEQECFVQIRRFLSFMPTNSSHLPPYSKTSDPITRQDERLLSIIPRRRSSPYKIREIISSVVDEGSWFEIGGRWGGSVVVGLARLGGYPVGVWASDCEVKGGGLEREGCMKLRRHIDLCETFGLPVLNLVDQPGFSVGTEAEKAASIRYGATVMTALYQATIPLFTVILRRAFGVAGAAMISSTTETFNQRVAWPSADWGSLPIEGGIEAAYKRRLNEASEKREQLKQELLAEFEAVRSPIKTAEAFEIPDIIDPRTTRPMACEWVKLVYEQVLPDRIVRRRTRGVEGVAYRP
ncbi:hypothetical protein BZG36_01170 [Bifiguratus adelaidae]|uniref:CoA carboxyltransferase C-terminal domain-containing protein n=1 Tax=Bifiguratus adelaidae TaxID=1938954 RepID=A0A261Y5M5_9FUNG|nr:hypothetical protein BZG36_01170 [Bifiguratus adelaidae]